MYPEDYLEWGRHMAAHIRQLYRLPAPKDSHFDKLMLYYYYKEIPLRKVKQKSINEFLNDYSLYGNS